MSLNLLSKLIRELLLDYNRVSLPGIGSFMVENASAFFSEKGTVINPPYRKISFCNKERWNDGLLEERYASSENIELEEAKKIITGFTNKIGSDLNLKRRLYLPDLGTIEINDKGIYYFNTDKNIFISKESFGLEPVTVKKLKRAGNIEQLIAKRSYKRLIIWLTVIVLLLALLTVIIIFNDQLKPLWEKLLYNKEEREMLKLLSKLSRSDSGIFFKCS